MQNIRLSINLLQVPGTRVIRMNNAANVPTLYVAIPVSELFVPKDKPEPRLMATAIHTPNAQYGDFMLKTYMSPEQYNALSHDERNNLPIIGKGTFMQAAVNKELAKASESVEAVDATIDPIPSSEPTNGPAAPLPPAPSPSVARPQTAAAPADVFHVIDNDGRSLGHYPTWNDAAAAAMANFAAVGVQQWQGVTMMAAWKYDNAKMAWTQTR